jgi:cytochrome c-type biogenesis protein CcsB
MIQVTLGLLANISFISLFFSMFLFWIYASFFAFQVESKSNQQSTHFFKNNNLFLFLGNLGMLCSNLTLFILLLIRWKESGHFPLSNLYESLIFLSWSCTSIHFAILFQFFNTSKNWSLRPLVLKNLTAFFFSNQFESKDSKKIEKRNIEKKILKQPIKMGIIPRLTGCLTAPCALFTDAFASFSLPEEMQKIAPLVPALQSNWLMMHVTVMIISYSALIIGSLLSIAYLVIISIKQKTQTPEQIQEINRRFQSNNLENVFFASVNNDVVIKAVPVVPVGRQTLEFSQTLDNLSYRILGFGFPFLTIGILSGAVWANEAWGSYWNWDPKETWALLTWLVFAIYLHTRISKGWEGKKPALIASSGFFFIWVCYLGVNLIGEGLHSYGWFSQA